MSDARSGTAVWVATRDLGAGERIEGGDFRSAQVRLPSGVSSSYVPSSQPLEGAVLGHPVGEGELLSARSLDTSATGPDTRVMTLPLTPDQVPFVDVRPGDRVDVFATFEERGGHPRTVHLLREVEVVRMVGHGSQTLGGAGPVAMAVAVPAEESARVSFAVQTAGLDFALIPHLSPRTLRLAPVTARDLP